MNITYKRDFSRSYMVVTGREKNVGFENQMIQANDVVCLLSFHTVEVDGETQYWYDITGKRTMRDYFAQEKVTREHVTAIIREMERACNEVAEYLIGQEHLLFSVDTIFLENNGGNDAVYFSYCPLRDKNIRNEFLSITEFLITEVNHGDEELRKVCYDLYEASLSEDFSLTKALGMLQEPVAPVEEEYQERCVQIRQQPLPEEPMYSEEPLQGNCDQTEWDEEEDATEEDSIFTELIERIRGWIANAMGGVTEKRKELFPLPSEEEDFVFDAVDLCEPKTQMLSEAVSQQVSRLVYEGRGKAPDILLKENVITIGSKAGENAVVIPSPAVSRYHARIRRVGEGSYELEDLNSTNGTYCNGELLSYREPHLLCRMDQILFANEPYRVVS